MLDRLLQRKILIELSDIYPQSANVKTSFQHSPKEQVQYNLFYLYEHDLIYLTHKTFYSGEIELGSCKITAKGLDFISDDGGLSSILGIVTIKFHEETIKALLIDKIGKIEPNPSIKNKLIEQVKSLPAEATKQVTMEALKSGIDNLPDIVLWLRRLLDL